MLTVSSVMPLSINSSSNLISSAMRMQTALGVARLAAKSATTTAEAEASKEAAAATAAVVGKPAEDSPEARWVSRRSSSSDGPRHEIDRRVVDDESARTTVISYSDGSSESLTQMKTDVMIEDLFRDTKPAQTVREQTAGLNARGLLIDRTG